jgi:hypothetical protein
VCVGLVVSSLTTVASVDAAIDSGRAVGGGSRITLRLGDDLGISDMGQLRRSVVADADRIVGSFGVGRADLSSVPETLISRRLLAPGAVIEVERGRFVEFSGESMEYSWLPVFDEWARPTTSAEALAWGGTAPDGGVSVLTFVRADEGGWELGAGMVQEGGGELWTMRRVNAGGLEIRRDFDDGRPIDPVIVPDASPVDESPDVAHGISAGTRTVDVLGVGATSGTGADFIDVATALSAQVNGISEFNQATSSSSSTNYTISGLTARLVGLMMVSRARTTYADDLAWLGRYDVSNPSQPAPPTSSDYQLAARVQTVADSLGADVKSGVWARQWTSPGTGACGITDLSSLNARRTFIWANQSGCTGVFVFSHEMGHIVTNNPYHSWDGNTTHGLGYCDSIAGMRSLMTDSTTTGCGSLTRMLRFSNPERLWPGTSGRASGTSTINNANRVAANGPGADWRSPPAVTAGFYQPLSDPLRILDSRDGTGGRMNPLQANQAYQVSALAGSMPSGPRDVAINVTVLSQGAAGSLWVRADSAVGGGSPVGTFEAGEVKAIGTIVRMGEYGTIWIKSSADAHVVVDVMGYFGGSANSQMIPLATPSRVCDTRYSGYLCATGSVPSGGSRQVPLTNQCPGTTSVSAAIVNLTAISTGQAGFLQARRSSSSPAAAWSNVNFAAGAVTSNLVLVPVVNQAFDVYVIGGADLIVDLVGCFSSAVAGRAYYSYLAGVQRFGQVMSGEVVNSVTNVGIASGVAFVSVRGESNTGATFLQVYPSSMSSPPATSVVNLLGTRNSSSTVVPVSASGTLTVRRGHPTGSSTVYVDQFGYFA